MNAFDAMLQRIIDTAHGAASKPVESMTEREKVCIAIAVGCEMGSFRTKEGTIEIRLANPIGIFRDGDGDLVVYEDRSGRVERHYLNPWEEIRKHG